MKTETAISCIRYTASLAAFCLTLGGCAANASGVAPDRLADAGRICRATMGLDPANVPFDLCVQSLLQNPAPATPPVPTAALSSAQSDAHKSCLQFGIAAGSDDAVGTCARNLDASLFEAANAAAR